jgi:hypothetical protein
MSYLKERNCGNCELAEEVNVAVNNSAVVNSAPSEELMKLKTYRRGCKRGANTLVAQKFDKCLHPVEFV